MSLKCTLGLAACIVTQGTVIPADDVVNMLDDCRTMERVRAVTLEDPMSIGYFMAEQLKRDGLDFTWSKNSATTYRNIVRACKILERDFNNDKKWKNTAKQQNE